MSIPIPGLDFINLWLLEDRDGWTIVDTGIKSKKITAWWEEIFASKLMGGRPVKRVDLHALPHRSPGTGRLADRALGAAWMSLGEWGLRAHT